MSFMGDVEDATLRYLWETKSCLVRLAASVGERQARSLTKNFRHRSFDIDLGAEFAKARDSVRIVEIPVVLLQPLEVPDRGIHCPDAPKRRNSQLIRHAALKEDSNVGLRVDRLDRRQGGRIESRRSHFGCAALRRIGRVRWLSPPELP